MRRYSAHKLSLDASHLIALPAATTDPATDPARVTDARLVGCQHPSMLARRDGCGDAAPETAAAWLVSPTLLPSLPRWVASSAPCRTAGCSSRAISSGRFTASLPHPCRSVHSLDAADGVG